ncbi:LEAF RUST 10 DISEASE-RESISTANCE LOCUS RECEPTOR-LIKE PROTEIN KINASE-like 1.2 isoform X4 [Prosopis cineraria]|uniref:LEAF RUST 10 DISEASE-RESISTANCE LOCUS RECEPTOR-LIKE PROTEIN KINASE-like 1.2 isoform X4 n=1 Tax=Prosopis cineraria TaxID=364024 RepID=UPI00241038E0|nr:LEAF RUST 10 DISEASE-RESISTANCE LOCUS RECEPTOR-LIKE PROTEIN KINASE-like 1.2 isoform X4 [Prosopis cineraria]
MSKPMYIIAALSFLCLRHRIADAYSSVCSSPPACGNVSVHYPFWLDNTSAQEYCGYPDFGLKCSDDGPPVITLPSDTYYVTDINYYLSTLTLVDTDVVNQSCPRARQNVSLENTPLSINHLDLNLSFYFNCSVSNNNYNIPATNTIGCLKNEGSKQSYVFETGSETDGYEWNIDCTEKVVVVVKEEEIRSMDLVTGFGGAMNQGFVLDWGKARDCMVCENSGGYCGFNRTTQQRLCFCKDGSIATKSCNKGAVTAAFVAIVMLTGFFFYQRRKKTSYAKSYMQSHATSSVSSMTVDPEINASKYFGVPVFTYTELEEATNNFDEARELGDGGFGTVYFGKLRDGRCVAVKRLYENNYKRVEQFINEVQILTRLRHTNLVSLYGCTSRHSRELLLVYEYIPNGTVADHLHGDRAKPGSLPWNIRMNIAIETASALAYLHASDIIHRDVKTNNILLDNHFVVKVADFGLSRLFPDHVTHVSTAPQGTPGYVDPEYHECYKLTDKSDVYSFGVVLIELISSLPAVDITRHRHEINLSTMAINKIQNRALHELVDPTLGFESDQKVRKMINAVAELAFQCLQNLKDMRPSMEEVLETLRDIESDGKHKSKPEVMDISDDVGLLKNDLPPPSSDSNLASKSTTSNSSS